MKSRKFIAAIVLFIASTAFVFAGHTEFSGWADMMKWVFGIYAAGNVGAATASRVKIGNTIDPVNPNIFKNFCFLISFLSMSTLST